MIDRVGQFFREKTPRRLLALSVFLGLLVLFRQLLVLLVFFVAFSKLMEVCAAPLSRVTRLPRKASVGVVALLLLALVGLGSTLGVRSGIAGIQTARETVPRKIAEFKETKLFDQISDQLPDADELLDRAKHYAASVLHAVTFVGHLAAYALVGFILALVFVLEEEHLAEWAQTIEPSSLRGTLLRWLRYVADALLVTVQFQLVVAACNALLTFPVLLLVGIPHAPLLALLIFASGLVPVVGNFAMGVVLSILAFQAKGWFGVGLFTALTLVLHKLESYYLNPRLAARHVHLPSFLFILSLVAWEHLLGIPGLFLSFPFLYVATRIRKDFQNEDAALGERGEVPGVLAVR